MKKIFSLVAIAAVAATMFTSCKDEDKPNGEVKKAKLSLSTEKTTVAVKATGTFTVTSDINAPEAIAVTVVSSDPTKLTVDPASVTIAKDKKTITGTYTGVAEGAAKITITTTSTMATIAKGEAEVTVGDAAPADGKIAKLVITPAEGWPGFEVSTEDESVYFNFYEVSYTPEELGGSTISMDLGKGNVLAMGTVNALGYLLLTPQAAGTAITLDAMVSPTNDRPIVWSPADGGQNNVALATGEDVYIAVACGDWNSTSDDYRAWVKINIKPAGGWSSLTIIEGAVCLDNSAFTVGQTK